MLSSKPDIYEDASFFFTPFKFTGLTVYSLPKRAAPRRLTIKPSDILIFIIVLLLLVLLSVWSASSCGNGISPTENSWIIEVLFSMISAEVFCTFVVSHLRSRDLRGAFEELDELGFEDFRAGRTKTSKSVALSRYGILVAEVLTDLGFVYFQGVDVSFIACAWERYVAQVWRIQTSCLYIFLVLECRQKIAWTNNGIEAALLLKSRIACIENSIPPKPDVCYKVDEARILVSRLMGLVEKINKVFQVQMLLKVFHVFLIVLMLGYFATDTYFYNKNLTSLETTVNLLYLITYSAFFCLDLFLDIWFYGTLEEEVARTSELLDKSFRALHLLPSSHNKQVQREEKLVLIIFLLDFRLGCFT